MDINDKDRVKHQRQIVNVNLIQVAITDNEMFIMPILFAVETITEPTEIETTTAIWREESSEPTAEAEPTESGDHVDPDDTNPLEPLAQTSIRFETQVAHTVQAIVSWHNQMEQDGCSSAASQQTYQNYTLTYSTLEHPEDTKTKRSTTPFILLTNLMPNQDYTYEVTSRDSQGNLLWSGRGYLSTG